MITPRVPITPVLIPPFSKMVFIIHAVVVFPLVPVMPTVFSLAAGWPNSAADQKDFQMKQVAFQVYAVNQIQHRDSQEIAA